MNYNICSPFSVASRAEMDTGVLARCQRCTKSKTRSIFHTRTQRTCLWQYIWLCAVIFLFCSEATNTTSPVAGESSSTECLASLVHDLGTAVSHNKSAITDIANSFVVCEMGSKAKTLRVCSLCLTLSLHALFDSFIRNLSDGLKSQDTEGLQCLKKLDCETY